MEKQEQTPEPDAIATATYRPSETADPAPLLPTSTRTSAVEQGLWQEFQLPPGTGYQPVVAPLPGGSFLLFDGDLRGPDAPAEWIEDPETGFLVEAPESATTAGSWRFGIRTGIAKPTQEMAELFKGGYSQQATIALADGRVAAMAPRPADLTSILAIYDPLRQVWVEVFSVPTLAFGAIGMFETDDGKILAHGALEVDVSTTQFGGQQIALSNETHVFVFDLVTGEKSVESMGPLTRPHWVGAGHAARLPEGRFLFIQGEELEAEQSALFDPDTGEWQVIDGPFVSTDWHLTTAGDGIVVAVDHDSTVWQLEPATLTWTRMNDVPGDRLVAHPVGVLPWGFPVWESASPDGTGLLIYVPERDEWLALDRPIPDGTVMMSSAGELVIFGWNKDAGNPTAWVLLDPLSSAVPLVR